jgi:hypothetical protein
VSPRIRQVLPRLTRAQLTPRTARPIWARLCAGFAASVLLSGSLAAQRPDSVAGPPIADSAVADPGSKAARQQILAEPHVVHWYEAASALGGVGVLMLLDEPAQRFVQHHVRSNTTDDISSVFRQEGEAPYYAGISSGCWGLASSLGSQEYAARAPAWSPPSECQLRKWR